MAESPHVGMWVCGYVGMKAMHSAVMKNTPHVGIWACRHVVVQSCPQEGVST